MRLGFDIDEVICDLINPLADYINTKYNIKWSKYDFTCYCLMDSKFVEDTELNHKIIEDSITTICDPDFQALASPFEDSVKSLRQYKRIGHTIHLITSRFSDKKQIANWLRKYKIPFTTIHTNLGCHNNVDAKGKIGKLLQLDMYVDDLEDNLLSMWKYKKRWTKGLLLFDRPWNKEAHDESKFTRVYSWSDIDRCLGIHNR